MKVPLSWLHEFVDPGLAVPALLDVMSAHGLEVEEVRRPGAGVRDVTTARVLERAPHPDADNLQVVRVTRGSDDIEVVCGAWNFEVGDIVLHAGVGARLPGGLELTARRIRGVTSHGMLCSARELEVGDDHAGIMTLPPDTPLGQDVHDLLPLGEPVIDVAVLADRGDHHSLLGVARELAAVLDLELRRPPVPDAPTPDGVPVALEADDGCTQFVAWTVEDVAGETAPWWLRRRLEVCGIRSIGLTVDVTNYVMLELGQPLHAYDLDRLAGPRLLVRWARDGERLVTLDDRERTLSPGDLVVADADGAVGLGGVMGGADTEVGPRTSRVVIEGATWDPPTIRRTSRRLGLVSEASLRFERRVDPAIAPVAVARACGLLAELAGGRPVGATTAGGPGTRRAPVSFDAAWAARFLGVDGLPPETQADYLRRLGCDVAAEGAELTVTPPTWRGDLARPADLVEEVARLHGYDRIPATMPVVATAGGLTATQRAERDIHAACRAFGFHEAQLRPFVGSGALRGVAPSDGEVALSNPLAADAASLRPSLLEGLVGALRRNAGQGRPGVALYEMGRIFRPAGDAIDDHLKAFGDAWRWHAPDGADLPTQPRTLGLGAFGLRHGAGWLDPDGTWSPFDLLAVFDEVVARLAPTDRRDWRLRRRQEARPGFHPGRCAALTLQDVEVGIVGELHPEVVEARDLTSPVVLGELLLEPLLEAYAAGHDARPAPTLVRRPALVVDVALVAPDEVPYAELEAVVRRGAGDLLEERWQFDEYRGEQVGEGRRSVAVRLRLQAPDRQLTDADAEAVIDRVAREAEAVGAVLRR